MPPQQTKVTASKFVLFWVGYAENYIPISCLARCDSGKAQKNALLDHIFCDFNSDFECHKERPEEERNYFQTLTLQLFECIYWQSKVFLLI